MRKDVSKKFVEALKEIAKERIGYVPEQLVFLGERAADPVANFVRFYNSAMNKGALDVKTKELIGLAIAVCQGCIHCMEWHTIGALEEGASEDEIAETLAVAMLMTGGPGIITGPEPVIKSINRYKEKKGVKE